MDRKGKAALAYVLVAIFAFATLSVSSEYNELRHRKPERISYVVHDTIYVEVVKKTVVREVVPKTDTLTDTIVIIEPALPRYAVPDVNVKYNSSKGRRGKKGTVSFSTDGYVPGPVVAAEQYDARRRTLRSEIGYRLDGMSEVGIHHRHSFRSDKYDVGVDLKLKF